MRPELVFPGLDASTLKQVVERLAPAFAVAGDVPPAEVEAALWRGLSDVTGAVGHGVALPHAVVEGLHEPLVAIALLARPLGIATHDGVAPDVLFCILAPPNAPTQHLLLLAHIARLAHSRVLLEGLRHARTTDAVVALLRAADARDQPVRVAPAAPPTAGQLVTITIAGEEAVDALIVQLVGMELDDATILDGQSLREAVAREVPLFSGFRDLFGDPGGRRVLLVEAPADRVSSVLAAVETVCATHEVRHARVTATPITTRWEHTPPGREDGAGGH
ncbi:MAG: hypothetical protein EP329_21190 [Deltaproteobacteria bacterium]|nr:MAG: hypothetical protein EP329_21190 [Deltaproteobacteria bacterium]